MEPSLPPQSLPGVSLVETRGAEGTAAVEAEGTTSGSRGNAQDWTRWWPEVAIVLVALLMRLVLLGMKPPHFDEGVNGFFVDWMLRQGFYHYDPNNFHGPLHFYVLFLCQTLLGRHVWALRLPIALFSAGAVVVMLAYRRYWSATTCRVAALAMAISPAMTFYGRYAIHESFLLLSLMVTVWGLLGLYYVGGRRELWATALGMTGMILTKETYAIHLIALGLAYPALLLLEQIYPSAAEEPCVRQRWSEDDLKWVLALCAGAILFFYSGGFMDWIGVPGLWLTFMTWTKTGMEHEGGHSKEWHYWLNLMSEYEWPAVAGLLACTWLAWKGRSRSLRYVALAGLASVCAYTIIRYKTPWCIIVFLWPFYLVLGALVEWLGSRWPMAGRGAAAMVMVLLLGHSSIQAGRLNFLYYADDTERPLLWTKFFDEPVHSYVYVQTLPTVERIMGPLRAKVQADPTNYQLRGRLLTEGEGDTHPLPWLLGDFPNISYLHKKSPPGTDEENTADFLLIEEAYVGDVEGRLQEPYFREDFIMRGSSGQVFYLYWRASVFADLFPGRRPEYQPGTRTIPASDEDLIFPVEEEEPAARERPAEPGVVAPAL
jgi:uncharacterized protein (TIGR03663 family)